MKFLFLFFIFISLGVKASSTLIYEAQKKGINLTEEDKEILETGKISDARYITGGILGTYPIGLGVGHAIQGRWSNKGWIFTAGEVGSLALVVSGVLSCADETFNSENCSGAESAVIVTGVLGFIGFRIWEIVDVWAGPPSQNKKYRELKEYINRAPDKKASLDLVPMFTPKFGQGLALKYSF